MNTFIQFKLQEFRYICLNPYDTLPSAYYFILLFVHWLFHVCIDKIVMNIFVLLRITDCKFYNIDLHIIPNKTDLQISRLGYFVVVNLHVKTCLHSQITYLFRTLEYRLGHEDSTISIFHPCSVYMKINVYLYAFV